MAYSKFPAPDKIRGIYKTTWKRGARLRRKKDASKEVQAHFSAIHCESLQSPDK